MANEFINAAIPPGEFIQDELDERGWTQEDLARVIGKHAPGLNLIITGKRAVTLETAQLLAAAFGTSPDFWLNLETAYQVAKTTGPTTDIQQRAKLFEYAPVKEMEKRGWIRETTHTSDLFAELCKFFRVADLNEPPPLSMAARQSVSESSLTSPQVAWCYRALQLAQSVKAEAFSREKLRAALPELKAFARYPQSAREVPRFLASCGVRVVAIEHLQKTKIDGAALWADSVTPIIALSLRYGRMDYFWHTLEHEIDHVLNDGPVMIDVDLSTQNVSEWAVDTNVEQRANSNAAHALIEREVLDSFIARVRPFYSKERINQFANRLKIHPSIIVGQLQHRGEVGWQANREMLADIREPFLAGVIADGFGIIPKAR